jgi:hypothetical protein
MIVKPSIPVTIALSPLADSAEHSDTDINNQAESDAIDRKKASHNLILSDEQSAKAHQHTSDAAEENEESDSMFHVLILPS